WRAEIDPHAPIELVVVVIAGSGVGEQGEPGNAGKAGLELGAGMGDEIALRVGADAEIEGKVGGGVPLQVGPAEKPVVGALAELNAGLGGQGQLVEIHLALAAEPGHVGMAAERSVGIPADVGGIEAEQALAGVAPEQVAADAVGHVAVTHTDEAVELGAIAVVEGDRVGALDASQAVGTDAILVAYAAEDAH